MRSSARRLSFLVLAGAWLLGAAACSDRAADPAASIQQGTLLTLADGDVEGAVAGGTRRFLGIPFAALPVGELRWRPPAPPAPWSGTLQVKQSAAPARSVRRPSARRARTRTAST